MDLYLFRLSLSETPNLFSPSGEDGRRLSREAWVRAFFEKKREFVHFNNNFVFVPEKDVPWPEAEGLVFGWIARQIEQLERTAPSEGLAAITHASWQAAFIGIDPTEHADGQKAAVESHVSIGTPSAVLGSLIRAMNQIEDAPYFTQEYEIIEEGSFWQFASNHNEQIKSITFDVAAPNMFNDANDFQNEMRSLRDRENVSNVKSTLSSDTTINHRTERLKDIIDYTERGAGRLSATAADGEVYHSEKHAKHITVEVEHHSKGVPEFLRQIALWLDKVF